jgi:hypothetical protein
VSPRALAVLRLTTSSKGSQPQEQMTSQRGIGHRSARRNRPILGVRRHDMNPRWKGQLVPVNIAAERLGKLTCALFCLLEEFYEPQELAREDRPGVRRIHVCAGVLGREAIAVPRGRLVMLAIHAVPPLTSDDSP